MARELKYASRCACPWRPGVRLRPDGTQYITRGNQLFASGKYEDAVLNYRNAIKKDPKSGEAFYRLALALFRTNKSRTDTNR